MTIKLFISWWIIISLFGGLISMDFDKKDPAKGISFYYLGPTMIIGKEIQVEPPHPCFVRNKDFEVDVRQDDACKAPPKTMEEVVQLRKEF